MIRIASPPENVVGQFMPPAHHAILLSGIFCFHKCKTRCRTHCYLNTTCSMPMLLRVRLYKCHQGWNLCKWAGSSTKPRPCWTKRCQFDKDFETVTIVLLNLSAAKKIRTYFDLDSETIAHEHASKICVWRVLKIHLAAFYDLPIWIHLVSRTKYPVRNAWTAHWVQKCHIHIYRYLYVYRWINRDMEG